MQRKTERPQFESGTEEEALVTPDFSVFRTRLPRPTSTMGHLVLAGATFVLALIAAIFYAER